VLIFLDYFELNECISTTLNVTEVQVLTNKNCKSIWLLNLSCHAERFLW